MRIKNINRKEDPEEKKSVLDQIAHELELKSREENTYDLDQVLFNTKDLDASDEHIS